MRIERYNMKSSSLKKNLSPLVLLVILLVLSLSGCEQQNKVDHTIQDREPTILYVSHGNSSYYQTIQDALNNSIDGDRIQITNGTYHEALTIRTSIHLSGENKNTTFIQPIITEKNTQLTIMRIDADDCFLENISITVQNHSTAIRAISVNASNITIYNNIIYGVNEGIFLSAFSTHNKIFSNKILHNRYGIQAQGSKNNHIAHNNFSFNTLYSIYCVDNGNQNTITHNIFFNNNYGLRIKTSKYNEIYNNCIRKNNQGIYCCCGAYYNEVYSNVFQENRDVDAKEDSSLVNFWFNHTTHIGNYWDKYTGADEDNDGFGDSPFEIPEAHNVDAYPLMIPPANTECN